MTPYFIYMKKILLALLLCVAYCSCSSDLSEEVQIGSISGSVSDRTTGEPVSTVNVTLTPGGRSTVTGSDGSFSFTQLDPGSYTVGISKEGYTPNTGTVQVKAGKATEAHLLIERIPAKITTDRQVLDYGENNSLNTLSFNIVNSSYEDLEWEITHACAWIKEVKPASGTLKYGKTATIVIVIDRESVPTGESEANVVVTTKNGGGSVEVHLKVMRAEPHLPKLNVLEPQTITATTAIFVGEIMDAGNPEYTERGFVYSIKTMPTLDNALEKISAVVTSETQYSYKVKGLMLNQSYYVRAYAANSLGVAYSANQVRFTTQAVTASVVMNEVTNINLVNGTAILHGTITDAGDPAYIERGFVYSSVSSVPTVYDTKIAVTGTGAGMYDVQVSNLNVGKIYYVRAYVKNEAGIAYSDTVQTFSTEESLPVVRTDAPTEENREQSSILLHGTVENSGTPTYTERGFVYSDIYKEPTLADNKFVVSGSETSSFERRVTELSSKKSYYIRAYATNNKGTVYGEVYQIFQRNVIILPSARLMVQPNDLGTGDWYMANLVAQSSIYEGYSDWRLPTKDELMILYNNRMLIGGLNNTRYWSGTFSHSNGVYNCYYVLNLDNGSIPIELRTSIASCSVRAVRTIED